MRRFLLSTSLAVLLAAPASAAEVAGRVAMPEVCAPEVSPAVVTLESTDGGKVAAPKGGPAALKLVDQRGLQFVPRVQAVTVGQTIRFTNQDTETHNVHVNTPGFQFNESMAPGQPRDFQPRKAGLLRLTCDVHSHMRAFIVVSASPWVQVCSRLGEFRFHDVPDGRYVLNVWHEMGEPLRRAVTVERGQAVDLATLTLTAPTYTLSAGQVAPVRPWSEVIDRISVLLASGLDAASRPGELKKARKLAEDAYWGEFEASEMETAVRLHLGYARAGALEGQFRDIVRAVRAVAEGKSDVASATDLNRRLLLGLINAAKDLERQGVTDRSHVHDRVVEAAAQPSFGSGDPHAQLGALKRGFQRVRALADQGEREDAASSMTSVYFEDFDPLEKLVIVHEPREGRDLELQFGALRGEIGAGLKGDALAERFAGLQSAVEAAVARIEARPSGAFGPAFAASLITIVREGVEVILILAMLLALVAQTGQAGATRAIWWGVGLAALASAATALGLNLLVASAHGRARENLEGLVMLTAAGVLFYVSYWLISQSESKRWLDFLKRQAQAGVAAGGTLTLALTAFLAVYREGAETALMYQAMIGTQAHSRPGLLGLASGLGAGVVVLALVARAIRATSVRLPLRTFFKATGAVLFALAVVFAGNGVWELQQSGVLRTTTLAWAQQWLGQGVQTLGLYPTAQALSVQGMLLAGAALALLLMATENRVEAKH